MNKIQLPLIYSVTSHSEHVGKDSTFVAIKGQKTDGMFYIISALERGAREIVVQDDVRIPALVEQEIKEAGAVLTRVSDCKKALAELSAQRNGFPAKKLKIIGITGTKGKTTTSHMMYQLFQSAGYKSALLSTASKIILDQEVSLELTTPQPDHIHTFLRICVEHDVEVVVMEVSAQSLHLHRVATIEFDGIVFTNFSYEHLEFFKDMDEYFAAKCLLFKQLKKDGVVFVNYDDPYGRILCDKHSEYKKYSFEDSRADMYAKSSLEGNVKLDVYEDGVAYHIPTRLYGTFNSYNMLAAVSIARAFAIPFEKIIAGADTIQLIPGRMERYELQNGAACFIDYAHNPSSYEAVLSTLRNMTDHLIVIFGAGGARDRARRPMMGKIADQFADVVILTADNPRDEDPEEIINDIAQGFSVDTKLTVLREIDRQLAIEMGCQMSRKGTVIAILGKGNDEYQIIGDLKFVFKERAIIQKFVTL